MSYAVILAFSKQANFVKIGVYSSTVHCGGSSPIQISLEIKNLIILLPYWLILAFT